MSTDTRKMMIYLPKEQSQRVTQLATKLDRPLSWVIQRAIDLSYDKLSGLQPQIPDEIKRVFWKNLGVSDRKQTGQDSSAIEKFSVQVVRDYIYSWTDLPIAGKLAMHRA